MISSEYRTKEPKTTVRRWRGPQGVNEQRDSEDRPRYVVELMIQYVLSAGVKCRPPASAHNLDSVSVELDLLCCAESCVAYR